FMNEARVDQLGMKPIEADLARVQQIADKPALVRALAAFQREGITGLFGGFVTTDAKRSDRYIIYLNQSGLTLPDESYYREASFEPIRSKFTAHVEKMLELAGIAAPKAAAARVLTGLHGSKASELLRSTSSSSGSLFTFPPSASCWTRFPSMTGSSG